MKTIICHEIKGRIRLDCGLGRLTDRQSDILYFYLINLSQVKKAKVYARSGHIALEYCGSRAELLRQIEEFSLESAAKPESSLCAARALNREYTDKLIKKCIKRTVFRFFVPAPFSSAYTLYNAVGYIKKGIAALRRRRLEVSVLDATAIAVSIARSDFTTAASVMFLLGIGELMEEWTHKKSVADLAGSMSLNIDKVWLHRAEGDTLVSVKSIRTGDIIFCNMGGLIPLDGTVASGEAMVNQASLTGESLPVRKTEGASVYAGTAIEEGELYIKVNKSSGSTRYEKIIKMIEESEKLKSSLESQAEHLADRLVPYSFGATLLTLLLTRNVQKAVSILMVDFSCALKLAMPVAVLSAMRECNQYGITVKGGKFLEAVANADTIVFDKTGTLTKVQPVVRAVVAFDGHDKDEILRTAACLEEHFPHSIANAVVKAAEEKNLKHEEMHAKVEYVIAHGIASYIGDDAVKIGSYHFIFEDGSCTISQNEQEKFNTLPEDCSLLYLDIGGRLAGVICIEDPLREEAAEVVSRLRELGFKHLVMMTGDSERTAHAIAKRVGVDSYYSEVLPEDKASFVEAEKAKGHTVVMLGDGINDSPALSAADAGIAVCSGAQIAREIADITVSADNLYSLVELKTISNLLIRRIHGNYRTVIGFNSGLIACGLLGMLQPKSSALLHNASTLCIGLHSMTNLI